MAKIGIIGGSGLYEIPGMNVLERKELETPFGPPSGKFILGSMEGRDVVFLPRHGKKHHLLPSEINYRANIYAMKKLGVEQIISVSAVGSLREEVKPTEFLLPDQFIDRTNQARKSSFFGDGIVVHIGFAQPVCMRLARLIYNCARELKLAVHDKGIYVNMEGPAFSTRAESFLYKSWGMDVIGMTNVTEARLSREAEICYAVIAMVTDYDCWHSEEETVSAELILQNMRKLTANAKRLIKLAVQRIELKRKCACSRSLKDALVTRAEDVPEETKEKLKLIIGKYIK